MNYRVSLLFPLLFAAPAFAQSDQNAPSVEDKTQASQSAENFSLDLPADETIPVPEAAPAPARASEAPAADTSAPVSRFTIDSPIELLLANVRARAILDRNLPGISTDKNLDKIRNLSLRALQSHSGGKLTDAMLDKTGKELAAIPPDTRLPKGR